MIIEDPLVFFKTPEHIVSINLVDVINRFTSMIEEYLLEPELAYIHNADSTVILRGADKFTDDKGNAIKFTDFLKVSGCYLINDKVHNLNSHYSRKTYRLLTKEVIARTILIAFIKDDIAKRSNWEATYDLENVISHYISDKYNITDVVDYIVQRIDPFIISVTEHYYGKDWNIHEVEFDGYRLVLKRYGDWRAFKWNQEQYDRRWREEHGE